MSTETDENALAVKAKQELAQRASMESEDGRGLVLRSFEDVWRFATCIIKSGLAPKGLDTTEAAVIAIQMGAEVGLGPLAAVQNIAVINGRPSMWGDAVLAVARSSPHWDDSVFAEWSDGEGESFAAHCRVRRRGGQAIERVFSIAQAKKANLWGKPGPWQQYPERMLQMRARSWAIRDGFADALRGIGVREEIQDFIEAEPAETVPTIRPPQSKVQQQADPLPPATNISEPQRKRLFAMLRGSGKTADELKRYLDAEFNITSTNDITLAIYDEVSKWCETAK